LLYCGSHTVECKQFLLLLIDAKPSVSATFIDNGILAVDAAGGFVQAGAATAFVLGQASAVTRCTNMDLFGRAGEQCLSAGMGCGAQCHDSVASTSA